MNLNSGVTYLLNSTQLISSPDVLRLPHSLWLRGPGFLVNGLIISISISPVESVDDDIENRKKVGNMKTERSDPLEKVLSLTTRLTKFLYSNSLKRIITTYRS